MVGGTAAVSAQDSRKIKLYLNAVVFTAPGEEIVFANSVSGAELMQRAQQQGLQVAGFAPTGAGFPGAPQFQSAPGYAPSGFPGAPQGGFPGAPAGAPQFAPQPGGFPGAGAPGPNGFQQPTFGGAAPSASPMTTFPSNGQPQFAPQGQPQQQQFPGQQYGQPQFPQR
jgi:hypothetical protein